MLVGMATKLEKLLEKEAQLKAQIQQAKAAERTLEKKRDTRRKILIGAAVMARVQSGEWPEADLKMMMDGFLTRLHERVLFDLDDVSDRAGSDAAGSASAAVADVNESAKQGQRAGQKKTVEKTVKKRFSEPSVDLEKEFNL